MLHVLPSAHHKLGNVQVPAIQSWAKTRKSLPCGACVLVGGKCTITWSNTRHLRWLSGIQRKIMQGRGQGLWKKEHQWWALLLFVYSYIFSRTDTEPVFVSWTLHLLYCWPCEAQEIFVDWTQEASFTELIWYGNSLPFPAFDGISIGRTTHGSPKKEVTVYFWGGFLPFSSVIRAQRMLTLLNRASALAHREQQQQQKK